MADKSGAPRAARLAGLVAAAQGAGLLVAAVAFAVATLLDEPESYGRGLFAAVILLAAGVLLMRVGLGIARVEAWARAPVVVAQVLLIPVGYTLAITADLPLYGVPILALCAAELLLLFSPESRLAFAAAAAAAAQR